MGGESGLGSASPCSDYEKGAPLPPGRLHHIPSRCFQALTPEPITITLYDKKRLCRCNSNKDFAVGT